MTRSRADDCQTQKVNLDGQMLIKSVLMSLSNNPAQIRRARLPRPTLLG
jgi:hypothetical protein